MKKLLNISVIAALAILPLAANATPVAGNPEATVAAADEAGVTASNGPKYGLAQQDANVDGVVATAGYVKGAYNAAIKAINKVSETAGNAANQDLSNLSNTGKANVSAQGTYDASINYTEGTVGAAIKSKADAATTYTKSEVDSALSGKQNTLTTAQQDAVDSGITSAKVSDYDNLVTNSANYATQTGTAATAAAAVNGATVTTDLSSLDVTTGAVTGTATISVVDTWGATAPATNGVAVDLTNTVAVTGLTGKNGVTNSISAGAVNYTAQ